MCQCKFLGLSYSGTGAGLDDACGSLTTQDIRRLCPSVCWEKERDLSWNQHSSSLPWSLLIPPRASCAEGPPSTPYISKTWTLDWVKYLRSPGEHGPALPNITSAQLQGHTRTLTLAQRHPKRPHANAPSLGCLSSSGAPSSGTAFPPPP